ncbi:hypothetical protein Tco_0228584 [Tanacetum coccineum]
MSHSLSSHTTHTVSKSGHIDSLSRHPTLDSEEELTDHEVSSGRSADIPILTPAPTSDSSPPTRQGPLFRQIARKRVPILVRVS